MALQAAVWRASLSLWLFQLQQCMGLLDWRQTDVMEQPFGQLWRQALRQHQANEAVFHNLYCRLQSSRACHNFHQTLIYPGYSNPSMRKFYGVDRR
jgi:hypothetical protein